MIIRTPYGNEYHVNAKGEISNKNAKPSGSWKMLGIQHVKRSEFIPFRELTPSTVAGLKLLWRTSKNPQYTVRDLDHGSTRVWGNTKYHGIKSIEF